MYEKIRRKIFSEEGNNRIVDWRALLQIMFEPQESSVMESAKCSGGIPKWRVLRKAMQEIIFATYCGKSEAINDAFRNKFLAII